MIKIPNKLIVLVQLLFILIFFTSCIGAKELNTLGIIISTGVDLENGEIVITNEVINPASASASKGGDMTESTVFVQSRGKTVVDAISRATLTFDRKLYFPHNKLIIFGEELAREGLGPYIDVLCRNTDQRETSYMLVSQGEKAYNVMGINSGISNSPGKYMYEILKSDSFNGETRNISVSEFLRYYYRTQEGYILGVVRVVKKPQINKMLPDETIEAICVEEGSVFKDDKLIGYYSGEEMIGFNFLVDNLESTDIVFETPSHVEGTRTQIADSGIYSVIKVFKSKTKLDIKLEQERLHLYVDVKVRGTLLETEELLNLSDSKVLKLLEEVSAKKIERIIENTLIKAQDEYELDSFSIGHLVHRKYPKLWKEIKDDWEGIFTELDYTIKVDVAIADTGFTNVPPNMRKGKHNE